MGNHRDIKKTIANMMAEVQTARAGIQLNTGLLEQGVGFQQEVQQPHTGIQFNAPVMEEQDHQHRLSGSLTVNGFREAHVNGTQSVSFSSYPSTHFPEGCAECEL